MGGIFPRLLKAAEKYGKTALHLDIQSIELVAQQLNEWSLPSHPYYATKLGFRTNLGSGDVAVFRTFGLDLPEGKPTLATGSWIRSANARLTLFLNNLVEPESLPKATKQMV